MPSIAFSDVMTILYVLVDDWYQTSSHSTTSPAPGPAPALTPSEVLTILLAMDVVPFPSERSFLGFLRATHGNVFPTYPIKANLIAMRGGCVACASHSGGRGSRHGQRSHAHRLFSIPNPFPSSATDGRNAAVISLEVPAMGIVQAANSIILATNSSC